MCNIAKYTILPRNIVVQDKVPLLGKSTRLRNGYFCVSIIEILGHIILTEYTISKSTFGHASYAAFRPSYPRALYDTVLAYHRGPKNLCVDLGCGHGLVARELSAGFEQAIGIDPSKGMIETAQKATPKDQYSHVDFRVSSAESLPFISDSSADLVVAGQAAHWFNYPRLFRELDRIVRPGGTLAFWGYKDHVFVDYPAATDILNDYAYDHSTEKLGSYWPKGREIVQDKLRPIKPDEYGWVDTKRIEYEPSTEGKATGQGTMFMHKKVTIGACKSYVRTWSSYHGWLEKHQDQQPREKGGQGDVVDKMVDDIAKKLPDFANEDFEVEIEWGSGLVMARRAEE